MSVLSLFDFELKKTAPSICLDQRWLLNGPNDYTQAISGPAAPKIPIGKIVTVYNHRIALIGTRLGNFVVFQNDDDPCGMVRYQCSPGLDHILSLTETHLTYDDFNRIFHPSENVGYWLETVRTIVMSSFLDSEVTI